MSSSDKVQDPTRLAAVRACGLVDAPLNPHIDALAARTATEFGTQIGLVSIVDQDRQFFAGAAGITLRQTALRQSLCRFVVATEHALRIDDGKTDPVFADHPAVTELGIRAYLGAPLRLPSGEVIGSFCIADFAPRVWTDADAARIEALAHEASALIADGMGEGKRS
jgi:GAF domain-containing protein